MQNKKNGELLNWLRLNEALLTPWTKHFFPVFSSVLISGTPEDENIRNLFSLQHELFFISLRKHNLERAAHCLKQYFESKKLIQRKKLFLMINAATKDTNLCYKHLKICLSAMGQSLPGGEAEVAHSAGIEYSFAGPTWHTFVEEGFNHSVYDSWKYLLRLQCLIFPPMIFKICLLNLSCLCISISILQNRRWSK